jgi:hypothetical protein
VDLIAGYSDTVKFHSQRPHDKKNRSPPPANFKMSSARLEVIKDDATIPPYMSRGMPAALDGLMAPGAFDSFCDRLDALLDLLDAEHKRRTKRFWWMYGAIYVWFMYFFIFAPISGFDYLPFTAVACFVHIASVWFCTARPSGAKTDKEVMRLIRSECDEMTRQTPFVSFHTVLVPVPAAARGARLQMDTIDHIGVSISLSASASGSATVAMVENTVESVKMSTASSGDVGHPVVYAQAVTSSRGDYQPVHADVEMV